MTKELWEEFIVDVKPPKNMEHLVDSVPVCGLCGNSGIVETNAKTPYGVPCGIRKFCICPNGRALKKSHVS